MRFPFYHISRVDITGIFQLRKPNEKDHESNLVKNT